MVFPVRVEASQIVDGLKREELAGMRVSGNLKVSLGGDYVSILKWRVVYAKNKDTLRPGRKILWLKTARDCRILLAKKNQVVRDSDPAVFKDDYSSINDCLI